MDLLSWLFPKRCAGCGRHGDYLCADCLNQLYPMTNLYCPICRKPSLHGHTHPHCKSSVNLDGLLSCFIYRGLIKRLIAKYKYKFVSDLNQTLIELFITESKFPQLFEHSWTLIPVPLHASRLRWRGYNQAELLSQGLSQAWHWPLKNNLLRRHRHTSSQMTLSGFARRKNLSGAFSINKAITIPTHILLIDDVATTAATLRECATVLKHAGAKSVWGLTLAQALP